MRAAESSRPDGRPRADPTDDGAGDRAARALLRDHGERVRTEQLQQAVRTLDCSDAERAAIERLADRLVARLLAPPRRTLETAEDDRVARTVRRLLTAD